MLSENLGQIQTLLDSIHPATEAEAEVVATALKNLPLNENRLSHSEDVSILVFREVILSIQAIFDEVKQRASSKGLEYENFCRSVRRGVLEKAKQLAPMSYHLSVIARLLEEFQLDARFTKNRLNAHALLSFLGDQPIPEEKDEEIQMIRVAIERGIEDLSSPERSSEFKKRVRSLIVRQVGVIGERAVLCAAAFRLEVSRIQEEDSRKILEGFKALKRGDAEIPKSFEGVRDFLTNWDQFVRPDDESLFTHFLFTSIDQMISYIEENPESYMKKNLKERELLALSLRPRDTLASHFNSDRITQLSNLVKKLAEVKALNDSLYQAVSEGESLEIVSQLIEKGAVPTKLMIDKVLKRYWRCLRDRLGEDRFRETFAVLSRLTQGSPNLKKEALDRAFGYFAPLILVNLLIKAGVKPDRDSLDAAICSGASIEVISRLMEVGAELDQGNLKSAIKYSTLAVVKFIAETGNLADIKISELLDDKDQVSPQIRAALEGRLKSKRKQDPNL